MAVLFYIPGTYRVVAIQVILVVLDLLYYLIITLKQVPRIPWNFHESYVHHLQVVVGKYDTISKSMSTTCIMIHILIKYQQLFSFWYKQA